MSIILYNGILCNDSDKLFSIQNRSFRYGDGFFESIKIVNQKVPLWDFHYQRLLESAMVLKLKMPIHLSSPKWLKYIELLIEKNEIKSGARARITFFRGAAGMYTPEANELDYILEVHATEQNYFELNSKPLIVDVYQEHLKSVDSLSNIKTNNCLLYVLASVMVAEKKLDDCILLNAHGNLCEGSSSNLFIIQKNTILTPPLSEGCLNGVMRKVILELAAEHSLAFIQKPLTVEDLMLADEVFFSSGTRGIISVGGYKIKRYFNTQTKKLLELLNEKTKGLIG